MSEETKQPELPEVHLDENENPDLVKEVKKQGFMDGEIAGIPTPYVVGGGVAVLALLLISRR